MFKKILIVCLLGAVPWQWAAAGVLPRDSAESYELTFWNSIKDSTHPEDYESYLQSYPKGQFAPLARGRIERLRLAAPRIDFPPPAAAPATPAVAKPPRRKARSAPVPAKAPPAPMPMPESPPVAFIPPPGNTAAVPPRARESKDCPTCPTVVELPKGLFTMGSDKGETAEKPSHSVALNQVFAIGKDEVTVKEWEACADAGACAPLADNANARDTDPVRNVNWDDAQRYVQWLSRFTGKPYRLPTEAEWEYAARGGPADVGPFAANPYGFQGMSSGVWEWVSDCWHGSYLGAPPDGSTWDEPSCQMRVVRGGDRREGVTYMKPSTRWRDFASVRDPRNGFRVARDSK